MRPIVSHTLTGLSLSVFLAALPVATGCASMPRPKVLDETSTLLQPKNPDARELAQLRPKMLKEARHYLEQAEQAYAKGQYAQAKLYAHMARQRYMTAQNYVARDAAKRLAAVMETSRQEAADRQAELERYDELEKRLNKVTKDINGKNGKPNAQALEAKKAILEARRKQADAIAAGAPTLAPKPYDKGKALVESAVDGLEMGLFADTIKTSARAEEAFDQSIEQARQAKAKQASAEERKAALGSQQDASSARILAESAINDARAARTAAVTAGTPSDDPARFQLGSTNLESAQQRFDRGDYQDATRLAKDAARAFRGVGNVAGAANQARKAVRDAEDARLDAMSRGGAGDPAMKQADFALDTARRALQQRDFVRARDKAKDARRMYAAMGARGADAGGLQQGQGRPGGIKRAAEDLVVKLKFQRAEMLGAMKDKSCPGQFRQFEAILQLASDRIDHQDYVRGYQFAVRAQERIRTCATAAATKSVAETTKAKLARTRAAKALQQAQVKLADAQTKLGEDDPRLKQPTKLLTSANRWYDRGDYEQAESLAKQVTRRLAAIRPGKHAAAAGGKEKQGATITKKQAADAIQKAQEAYASASGKLGNDQRLNQPAKLIEAAQRWFEHDLFGRAKSMADKATADIKKLTTKGGRRAQAKAGNRHGLKHPKTAKPGKAKVSCQQVREDVLRNEKLSKEVDNGKLTPRQKRDLGDAKAFTSSASRLVLQKKCSEAHDLTEQAFSMLFPLPRGRSHAATSKTSTKKHSHASVQGKPWQNAYERSAEAVQRRKQAMPLVQDATRATFAMGDSSLHKAQLAYRAKRWAQAEQKAEQAISAFDAVITAAGQMPKQVEKPQETALPSDPVERAQAVVANYGAGQQAMPPGWKDGYSRVIEALSLRDRAKEALGDDKSTDMDHGQQLLSQAHAAWKTRNYVGAKALADQAVDAFKKAIEKAEQVKAQPPVPKAKQAPTDEQDPQAFALADEALRQARTTLAVCEREHCDDRDFVELSSGKEMIASAAQSFEEHKYPYAEKLAKQATKKLREVLEKPRKTQKKPAVDPAEAAKARTEAEDALREANVAVKLCAKQGCDRVDYESWLRADGLMSGARAAFADTNNTRATTLAKDAEKLLRKILVQKPAFVMPDNVSGVSRSGDRLSVSPAIKFRRGSSVISGSSQPSVKALAEVLKRNIDNLQTVRVIGHTDNTGSARRNKQLSAARAAAVVASLVRLGVPKELLSSEGKGPDEPIADNSTREGRAANRRVEVRIQLKPRKTSSLSGVRPAAQRMTTRPATTLDRFATKEQRS